MTREEATERLKAILEEATSDEDAVCYVTSYDADALDMAIKALEQERNLGHWIEHPHEAGLNWEFSRYECSECHIWFDDDSSYCPECGADMMEESKCSKYNCPIDYTTLNPNCNLKDCPYRTE